MLYIRQLPVCEPTRALFNHENTR
uniref:Uncharacterized protein n=1 Tax=Rhizophora mucronata TaxID=61149 RepID=A0A2P2IHW1_RHIMU